MPRSSEVARGSGVAASKAKKSRPFGIRLSFATILRNILNSGFSY
jgi:hypothetical protein